MNVQADYVAIMQLVLTFLDHTFAAVTLVIKVMAQFVMVSNSYTGCIKKKLNKPEIALRLCKVPQCTKFFIEIGCLGTDNVV